MEKVNVFWFRRDLRLEDNVGFAYALRQNLPVLPIFIFDKNILDNLDNKKDRRVDYIHQAIHKMDVELKNNNSSLLVKYGKPIDVFNQLSKEYTINTVFCNEDYEQYGIERDNLISKNFNLQSFKDQVIFKYNEILKKDNTPYTVYTPYSKQWKEKIKDLKLTTLTPKLSNLLNFSSPFLSLETIGFEKTDMQFIKPTFNIENLKSYKETRDFPALDSTTKLGIALRFGTISVRTCVQAALKNNLETWLNELIWREFFMQILAFYPQSSTKAFRPKYDEIKWINNEKEFDSWCKGETGYPMVDAGMRELNETGFMHNRVRMVVASFLCKHLLIDWRWGEAYFANKLNDYDMSANVGNWQWAAGSGCDAAPYFRVFNPKLQQEKFDPDFKYIKKWVPNYNSTSYTKPIVDHDFARKRAIETYKACLDN